MFTCPHCFFPLTGRTNKHVSHGEEEEKVVCTHCKAILRITITTLLDPDKKRIEEKGINKAGPPTTSCPQCGTSFNLSELHEHVCPSQI